MSAVPSRLDRGHIDSVVCFISLTSVPLVGHNTTPLENQSYLCPDHGDEVVVNRESVSCFARCGLPPKMIGFPIVGSVIGNAPGLLAITDRGTHFIVLAI